MVKMFTGFRKQTPTDVWSVRERLCLASSVLKSGDQNWVSVSRAIRPFGEPNRPQDWFSQKNCALQYSDLLEKVETPKRKRGERGEIETPGESIVRKLTLERVDELRKLIAFQQQKHKKVKEELILVQSGQADDRLHEIWAEIQEEKKKQQQDAENHQKWLVEREAANQAASAALRAAKMVIIPRKPVPAKKVIPSHVLTDHGTDSDAFADSSQDDSPHVDSFGEESQSQDFAASAAAASAAANASTTAAVEVASMAGHPPTSAGSVSASVASNIAGSTMLSPTISTTHHSPLLNTLLRSSSSHASQTTATTPLITSKEVSPRSQASTSPTITSLLAAPNMAGSLNTSMASLLTSALSGPLEHHHLHHHDVTTHGPTARPPITSPSQGAPTLLKLLDMPLGITGKLPPLPIVTTEEDPPLRLLPPPPPITTTAPSEAVVASATMTTSSPIVAAIPTTASSLHPTTTFGDTSMASSVVDVSSSLQDSEVVVGGSVKVEREVVVSVEELPSLIEYVTEEDLDIVGESTVETTNRDDSSDLLLDVGDVEEVVIGGSGNTSSLDLSLDVVGLSEEVVLGSSGNTDDESLLDVLLTSTEKMDSMAVVEVTTAATTSVTEPVASMATGSGNAVTSVSSSFTRERSSSVDEVAVEKISHSKPITRAEAVAPSASTIKKEETSLKTGNVPIKIEVDTQPATVAETPTRAVKSEKTLPTSTASTTEHHSAVEKAKSTGRTGRSSTPVPIKVAVSSSDSSDDSDDADSVQSAGTGDYASTRSAESSGTRARSRRARGRRGGRWAAGRSGAAHVPPEDVTTETSTEGAAEETVRSRNRRGSQDTVAATILETPRRPARGSNVSTVEPQPTRSTRSRRDEREESVAPPEPEERVSRLRGESRRATPRGQQQPVATSQKPAAAAATLSDRAGGSTSRDVDELLEALRGDLEYDGKDDALGRVESLPNSPASTSFSGDDPESVRDYKVWKKAIMLVWRSAANHKNANVFLHPVTEEMAPGYHSIVYRPMDLMTVKRHIETGATRTTAEFQRDMMLMFQNAIMYNNSDHDVFGMANEMQREVCGHIQDFMATQLMVQSVRVPPKTTRRETREHANKKGGQESTMATPSSEKSSSATPEPDNKRKRLISDSESVGGKTKKRRTRADD